MKRAFFACDALYHQTGVVIDKNAHAMCSLTGGCQKIPYHRVEATDMNKKNVTTSMSCSLYLSEWTEY
jgi:hypothetical protein